MPVGLGDDAPQRGLGEWVASGADSRQLEERKLQVGSGDRSERIRTDNYPQGRVTDHRINLTLYQLAAIVDGALDEVIGPLQQEWQAEQLAALD